MGKANSFINDESGQMNSTVALGALMTLIFSVIVFGIIIDVGDDLIGENDTQTRAMFNEIQGYGYTIFKIIAVTVLIGGLMVIVYMFSGKN